MASPSADRPTDGAEQCASRYTIYSKYLSILERNQQAARASDVRVEAIEEFDEADGADYKLFRRIVYDQLAIYREQHNDAAIDELHSTVVGKFRRIFGHGHWNTINATLEYGQLLRGEKRYEQAETLYRTLVDEVDRDGGLESVAVLCIFNALGTVYAKRQKLNEAEAILVRAVAGFRTQSGDRDMRTLTAAFNLGGVYQDRGKLSRAISMYHGAAYGFKDVMGISDKTTIAAFTQLAALCFSRHDLPRAEEAYKLALRGLEETARQGSMDALILKLDLGVLYRDVGKLDAAELLTHEVWQGLKDARSGHAAAALTCLGTVYARQGRAAEAETSFSDAVKHFAACEAEYSAMAYAASFSLGNLLRSHRRLAEAEAMYQRAWNGARAVGGPQHATYCTIADALSSLYEEQGKYEEGEEVYKQSLAPGEFPGLSCIESRASRRCEASHANQQSRDCLRKRFDVLLGSIDCFSAAASGQQLIARTPWQVIETCLPTHYAQLVTLRTGFTLNSNGKYPLIENAIVRYTHGRRLIRTKEDQYSSNQPGSIYLWNSTNSWTYWLSPMSFI